MGLNLHMQMEQSSQMHLKFGDDVIVGVLDTGIYVHIPAVLHPVSIPAGSYIIFFLHFFDNLKNMVPKYSSTIK
jgi:hypothetical protein